MHFPAQGVQIWGHQKAEVSMEWGVGGELGKVEHLEQSYVDLGNRFQRKGGTNRPTVVRRAHFAKDRQVLLKQILHGHIERN